MVFSRLRCHFCGAKQPHDRQTKQFQCQSCEATNFLDGRGNIVDPPASITTGSQHRTFPLTRPRSPETQQQQQVFCRTCVQNQHLYNETLGNYLPDDDDPRYHEFEKRLPQFKAELEKRYPLICSRCAPIAQQQIHQADYHGMAQNAARLCAETRSKGGKSLDRSRDDWAKFAMRIILRLLGLLVYLELGTQLAYHAYSILGALQADTQPTVEPTVVHCATKAVLLRTEQSCSDLLASYVYQALVLAAFLLPYNPGQKYWYSHTHRIEAVRGQRNFVLLQLVMLAVRFAAWQKMSDVEFVETNLTQAQILFVHGFILCFIPAAQWLAERGIEPVRWTVKGNIMPHPKDKDILSAHAGPGQTQHMPEASQDNPFKYLQASQVNPFQSAVTQSQTQQRPYPTPEREDHDPDAMDIDSGPWTRSSRHAVTTSQNSLVTTQIHPGPNNISPRGLSDMRQQFGSFGAQQRAQQEAEMQAQQARLAFNSGGVASNSAFATPVPPAPMSQERRLRNPWATTQQRNEITKVPLAQQKDFMARMKAGVTPIKMTEAPQSDGGMQIAKGKWSLPGENRETGLEDRFGSFFGLDDEPTITSDDATKKANGGWWGGLLGR